MYFNELKNLYDFDQAQDLILFNNKEILVDGKTLFLRDGLTRAFYPSKISLTTPAIYCRIRNLTINTRANQTFFNTIRS